MGEYIKILHKEHSYNNTIFKPFSLLSDSEIERVWKMRNHPEISCWMANSDPILFEKHLAFMLNQKGQKKNFNFLAQVEGTPVGVISLHNTDFTNKTAWLGIYKNPEYLIPYTGRELLDGLCHIAFEVAQLHTLRLEVFPTNTRAIKLYQKAGFQKEGIRRECLKHGGRYLDMIQMSILDREWKSNEK